MNKAKILKWGTHSKGTLSKSTLSKSVCDRVSVFDGQNAVYNSNEVTIVIVIKRTRRTQITQYRYASKAHLMISRGREEKTS